MSQSTSSQKENDALAAFAGLVILMVILAILFLLTTPDVVGENTVADAANQTEIVVSNEPESIVVESTAEATEVVTVVEATDEPETVVVEATAEATEEAVVVSDANATAEEADTSSASSAPDPELIARGAQLFITCSACHGPDGHGIPGLGKDLVAGEFATSATDDELISVITNGRPIWDAANTTMVDMPAKGGNPALTEEDITAIVAYIRSLQTP